MTEKNGVLTSHKRGDGEKEMWWEEWWTHARPIIEEDEWRRRVRERETEWCGEGGGNWKKQAEDGPAHVPWEHTVKGAEVEHSYSVGADVTLIWCLIIRIIKNRLKMIFTARLKLTSNLDLIMLRCHKKKRRSLQAPRTSAWGSRVAEEALNTPSQPGLSRFPLSLVLLKWAALVLASLYADFSYKYSRELDLGSCFKQFLTFHWSFLKNKYMNIDLDKSIVAIWKGFKTPKRTKVHAS